MGRPAAGSGSPSAARPRGPGRWLVRHFDVLLRRAHGVREPWGDPDCVLRLALTCASEPLSLASGVHIQPGDLLAEIHLWNERLPIMPAEGADLRWAREMQKRFTASLRLLATELDEDPSLQAVRAVRGEAAFLASADLDAGARVLAHLGFEVRRPRLGASAWRRFAEFWQNLYSYALLWTYSPASLHGRAPWQLERFQMWMPRATLAGRYGRSREGGEG